MTQGDYLGFVAEVKRLATVYRMRLQASEADTLANAYFGSLRRFTLEQVIAGADAWIERESKFPKPAEWAARVPAAVADLPVLSADDAADWLHAERLRWEDAPCGCQSCVAADVTDKPLRFVPDADAMGLDRHALIGPRMVTTGHWAHGAELARWYEARANFWDAYYRAIGGPKAEPLKRILFKERIEAIFAARAVPVVVQE